MSITLPAAMPAAKELTAEGLHVLSKEAAAGAGKIPLKIAILNLMPTRRETERQLARLLGGSYPHVELTFFLPDGHQPRNETTAHIEAFYRRWSDIKDRRFDGLIITGAPVEQIPFEEVTYWSQMKEIFEWARLSVTRSYYICWAAQAALYHYHGIRKHQRATKLFGVYRQDIRQPDHKLFQGFHDAFPVPVSRYSEVYRAELPKDGRVEVLAESYESGLCLLEDRANRALMMFNHWEYETVTLAAEYRRDQASGTAMEPPRSYYLDNDPSSQPLNSWRHHGGLFFRNWLAELATAVAARRARRRTLEWLMATRRRFSLVGQPQVDFLLVLNTPENPVPLALGVLAHFGLAPRRVTLQRYDRACVRLELGVEDLSPPEMERLARELMRLRCSLGLAYANSNGAGGVLFDDGSTARVSSAEELTASSQAVGAG